MEQLLVGQGLDGTLAKHAAMPSGGASVATPANAPPRPHYRDSADVSDDEILEALDKTHWQIKEAAALLGLSRGTFYNLMHACPGVRQIDDLNEAEVEAVMVKFPGGLDVWAKELRIGRSALKRYIKELGL